MMKQIVKGPADGAVGVITLVAAIAFAVACFAAGILVNMFMPAFGGFSESAGRSPSFLGQDLIIGVLVVSALLYLATSIGIFCGRAWGFRFGVVLYGVLLLAGNGIGLFGLAGAVYCVLRLNGFLGGRAQASDGVKE